MADPIAVVLLGVELPGGGERGGNGLLAIAVVALVALAVLWLFGIAGRGSGGGEERRRGAAAMSGQGLASEARRLSGRLRGQQGPLDDVHRTISRIIQQPVLDEEVRRQLTNAFNTVDQMMSELRATSRDAERLADQLVD